MKWTTGPGSTGRQPFSLAGPPRAVILCTKMRQPRAWAALESPPCRALRGGAKPASAPALCGDRGGFVTRPLRSTQPGALGWPPFALGTEVQPCPGHCLVLPFGVCQSVKMQLPLRTHQAHGKPRATPEHSNSLSGPELQVPFPRSTGVTVGSPLVCKAFHPLLLLTNTFFFLPRDPLLQIFFFAKRSLGGPCAMRGVQCWLEREQVLCKGSHQKQTTTTKKLTSCRCFWDDLSSSPPGQLAPRTSPGLFQTKGSAVTWGPNTAHHARVCVCVLGPQVMAQSRL